MRSNKANREQLVQAIQARLGTADLQLVLDLLQALLEESKTALVQCDETQIVRVQSEARTYDKLLKLITRPRLKDMTQE